MDALRTSPSKQLRTILLAGLISGGFDAAYAVIYFGATRGVLPHRIFQHIASGLLGRGSFDLGWVSVILGVFCHFTVAIGASAVFWLATRHFRQLLGRPLLIGPLFGLAIYTVMNFVVVPLSRVTIRPGPDPIDILIGGLLVHMFLIGLPIVLIIQKGQGGTVRLDRRMAERESFGGVHS